MRWLSWFVCLTLLALLPALASAQLVQAVRPPGEDTHALRFLLSRILKCEPLKGIDDLNESPSDTVLIVLGSTTWMDDEEDIQDKLVEFLRGGGSVLIATDRDSSATMSRLFGIRAERRIVKTKDPKNDAIRPEWDDCPLVRNPNKSYFENIERIATHQPGYLRKSHEHERKVTSIARFPESCAVEDGPDKGKIPDFAMVCGQYPGRVLVLSSPSVFWNSLMLQYDNDNFAFAYQSLRWLTEADNQGAKRTKVLLMDDGNPVTSFDVKVREVPSNLPDNLTDLPAHPVDIANALLAKWEDENIHNELIFGRYTGGQILSGIVIALTVLLAIWLFLRIQQALQRAETG